METTETHRATPVVSTGDWVLTILITAIPLVNIIMLFVWGFGSGTNPSKANWAKAMLIWMLIGIVFTGIFWGFVDWSEFSGMENAEFQ